MFDEETGADRCDCWGENVSYSVSFILRVSEFVFCGVWYVSSGGAECSSEVLCVYNGSVSATEDTLASAGGYEFDVCVAEADLGTLWIADTPKPFSYEPLRATQRDREPSSEV